MTAAGTLVALSPHLDDVALSAAGALLGWPGPRLLVSVFSSEPPGPPSAIAAEFHASCGLDEQPMRRRQAEDRASCAVLGCEPVHLGLGEALYRAAPDGEPVIAAEPQLFEAGAGLEPAVIGAVAGALRGVLAAHPDAAVLVPLGTGCHRDHVIVREAAERVEAPLWAYYEEQPYGWWGRPPGPPLHAGWAREARPLKPLEWRAKLRSLACHGSQMKMLWGDGWREKLAADHARRDGAPVETLWRPR